MCHATNGRLAQKSVKQGLNGSEIIDILNTDSDCDITDDTDRDPTHSEDENSGKIFILGKEILM